MNRSASSPATRIAFPIRTWLPGYKRDWLRGDVIAALTTWALVVPQAIAYGQIAGLPPQAGLFTAFAGLLGYALFGTSRQLVVSPTSATAAISAALIAPLALGDPLRFAGLSSTLALMVGVVFLTLGVLRLGFVSQFVSTSVQTGLMFGLGLTIAAGQLPKLLGFSGTEGPFFDQCVNLIQQVGSVNGPTAVIGFASLAFLLAMKRFAPRAPAALIIVVAGIVAVTVFDLAARGVSVIGPVQTQIPLPALPAASLADIGALLAGAVAIAVIGYAESETVSEEFATKHRYDIAPNQELVALGAANVLSGLFQGFITCGGASQSAANERAGAKTQLSTLILSALMWLTCLALLPLFRNLPNPVLGAIVISAVIGFVNVRAMRRLLSLRRDAFALALITLFGVLALGLLPGLLLALMISLGLVLARISQPSASALGRLASQGHDNFVSLSANPQAQPIPGLLIYRLDAPLFAANAARFRASLLEMIATETTPPRVVLVDLEMSNDLDIKSIDTLARLHAELGERQAALWLARPHARVRDMLARSGLATTLGEAGIYRSVREGVQAFMTAFPQPQPQPLDSGESTTAASNVNPER
jgi:high affinity sulfate transporter 1